MSNPPGDEPIASYRTLHERAAGREPDRTLYEGVPDHLSEPLATWVQGAMGNSVGQEAARRALMRLRISIDDLRLAAQQYDRKTLTNYGDAVVYIVRSGHYADDELTVTDAIIGLHNGWDTQRAPELTAWIAHLYRLDQLLTDAGSAWILDMELRGLYRRVDETVMQAQRAAEKAAEAAGRPVAAARLRTAWQETYGVAPDPTKGYGDSVKAIEAIASPSVIPNDHEPTLGKVISAMRNQRWALALVDKQGQPWPADHTIEVLDQLWKGQRSRHDGGATTRDQTQAEAEAAVHLAALAVQWFSSGAITKAANS